MTITLNGETLEIDDPLASRLQDFLVNRGLKTDRIAVERNGEIVPRARWPEISLTEGDRLEIVHFVGGGTWSACTEASPNARRSHPIRPGAGPAA